MGRALLLVLAIALTQVAVSGTMAPAAICPEGCPDDGPDGRCPPICLSCPCSTHPAPLNSVAVVPAPPPPREAVRGPAIRVPGDPEPRDIFHVPKLHLA